MRCPLAAPSLLLAALLPLTGCAPIDLDPIAVTPDPAPAPSPSSARVLLPPPGSSPAAPSDLVRRPDRADLSGDGLPDFAVGAPLRSRVAVHVSSARPLTLDSPLSLFGASLEYVGDLDGDGYSDLAVGAPGSDAVALFSGTPEGVDPEPRSVIRGGPGSGFGATLAAVGDLDGDGRDDLVVGSVAGHRVSLLRGQPGAMPSRVSAELEGPADEGFATAITSLGDGRVVVALPGEGSLLVLTAREGAFQQRARILVAERRIVDIGLAALDANGDGRTDLAVTGGSLPGVVWIHGTADGFSSPVAGPGGSGAGTVLASATDLDGDGDDELLMASGAGLWMLPGDRAGTSSPVPWSVQSSGSTAALRVVRDLSPGGRVTLLRGVPGQDAVEVLRVDRDLRGVSQIEALRGDTGSAFGAAL